MYSGRSHFSRETANSISHGRYFGHSLKVKIIHNNLWKSKKYSLKVSHPGSQQNHANENLCFTKSG